MLQFLTNKCFNFDEWMLVFWLLNASILTNKWFIFWSINTFWKLNGKMCLVVVKANDCFYACYAVRPLNHPIIPRLTRRFKGCSKFHAITVLFTRPLTSLRRLVICVWMLYSSRLVNHPVLDLLSYSNPDKSFQNPGSSNWSGSSLSNFASHDQARNNPEPSSDPRRLSSAEEFTGFMSPFRTF